MKVHQDRLTFCNQLAQRSPDPSTKVGAMVYAKYNVSVGIGWNSFPLNSKACLSYYHNRPLKYDRIIHAEMRALLIAGDHAMEGSLYTSLVPCKECAKYICEAGITHVYFFESCLHSDWVKRFPDVVQVSMQLFAESDVNVVQVPDV